MITYYTALGRLITKEQEGRRIPVIIIDDNEFYVNIDELIIWSSIHWNILNERDLEKEYARRKMESRIFNDTSFTQTLERLKTRRLISSATDYVAADALYGLIGKLKIRPIEITLKSKIHSCIYMYFKKGMSIKSCIDTYFGTRITKNEKSILRLSEKVGITTAEIIKCMEENIADIKNEEDIMDKLYAEENETQERMFNNSRFSRIKIDILQAVSNLYLKKKIIFE